MSDAAYQMKVDDLARETLRLTTLRYHVGENIKVARLLADDSKDAYVAAELHRLADSLDRALAESRGTEPPTPLSPGAPS